MTNNPRDSRTKTRAQLDEAKNNLRSTRLEVLELLFQFKKDKTEMESITGKHTVDGPIDKMILWVLEKSKRNP